MTRRFTLPARSVALVAAVAAGALGLAACGSSSKPTTTGGGGTTLKIGFLGALTGADAQLGINIKNGELLAINQYNATNPKVKVSLDFFDSQGMATQATTGATKLVQDGDVALVGPAFSGESEAADPILQQAKIPFVSASATAVDLSQKGRTYFHRVVAADNAQGPADANYLVKTLGAKTVAVIDDSSSYGLPLGNYVRTRVGTAGGTVAVSDHIDPNGQDYSATVNKITAAKPAAVFFAGYYDAAGRLIKQLKANGYTGIFMSDDGAKDPQFIKDAGGAPANGAYLSCACADTSATPAGKAFGSSYQQAFGLAPSTYSGEAYDAADFILAAIKAGNTTRSAINNYLDTNSWNGVTKTIKFQTDGDLVGGTIYVYKVVNGQINQIATTTP